VTAGDAIWLEAIERALARVAEFGPKAMVLSIGLDASEHDSYEPALKVTNDGFAEAARRLARMQIPTLLVQEGGYLNAHLSKHLQTFLRVFDETSAATR
jgi:acetoin utilization deacetylase AcuC-like enzyme